MLELIPIGHTTKSRGISGQIKLKVSTEFIPDLTKARALFINLDGSRVPFLIEHIEDGNQLVVKLDAVENPESANALLSKEIFLDSNEVSHEALNFTKETHYLTGYAIYDQDKKSLGEIIELIEYPNQLLAKLIINSKEALIPVHDDLILDVNEEKKTLNLEIAPGLLDLYYE